MKVNSRQLLTVSLVIVIILTAASYLFLRVTVSEAVLNKMVQFHEVQPHSERIIQDKAAIRQFTYAIRFAKKQPGSVDITFPDYELTLGNKQYYLWISDQYSKGTLMKLPNTETIYTIDSKRTQKLLHIINKQYENNNE